MIRKNVTGLLVAIVMAAAWVSPAGAGSSSGTVIVMPARTRVVQLAFQVAAVKDVWLVAYNNNPALAEPLIHFWNGHEWKQIDREAYLAGSFLPTVASDVFILGDSTSLPVFMTWPPTWVKHVHKTADLNVANLLNEFGPVLKFSRSDWEWLADQNDLNLDDRNAERRHYGRWGKSGAQKPFTPVPSQPPMPEAMTLPPTAPAAKADSSKEAVMTPVPAPAAAKVPEAPKVSAEAPEAAKSPMPAVVPLTPPESIPAVTPDGTAPSTNMPAPVVTDPGSK